MDEGAFLEVGGRGGGVCHCAASGERALYADSETDDNCLSALLTVLLLLLLLLYHAPSCRSCVSSGCLWSARSGDGPRSPRGAGGWEGCWVAVLGWAPSGFGLWLCRLPALWAGLFS